MLNAKSVLGSLCVLGAMAIGTPAFAVVSGDSTTWESAVEFSVDSTGTVADMNAKYGFSVWLSTPNLYTTVAGGVLNFKPTAGASYPLWYVNSATGTLGTGDWSYEWRVQVVSTTGTNPLLYADNNSSNENVTFTTGFAGAGQIYGQFQGSPTNPATAAIMNSGGIGYSDWHVYRMTRTTVGATLDTVFKFYLDDNVIAIVTKDVDMTPKNTDNWFGFGSGSATGEYNLDYIRWTTEGAFVPEVIPEPASVALVGLGGLLLLIRRRS